MPYLPETNELLLNDEEAHWVSNNPTRWAEMMECEFKHPSSAPSFLGHRLQTCLTHYHERWFRPRSGFRLIKGELYSRIGVSFGWDAPTQSYLPVSVQGVRKGCKKPVRIGTATDLNIRWFADGPRHERHRQILQGETIWEPAV